MKKGIISFSFDDGRKDNRKVAEFLLKNSIPATFNITSGYIDGTCPRKLAPTNKFAMNTDDILWLFQNNIFEIALHGDKHLNTIEDIKEGRKKIINWMGLSNDCKLGFASPGTGLDLNLLDKEKDFFSDKLSYVRLGLRIKTNKYLRVLARKMGRIFHIPFLYRVAYKDTLMCLDEVDKIIYSVPVMRDITYKQIKALIDLCIKEKKVLVIMLHSIEKTPNRNDAWSWEEIKFKKTCEYIQKMIRLEKLEVVTVQELYNRAHFNKTI